MHRRRLTMALLLLLPLCWPTVGQDEPTGEGGGGPMPSLLFLQLDTLNSAITSAGYPRLSDLMFTMGGSGYGGTGDGLRFGGMGGGGMTSATNGERSATLDFEYYGMLIEKATQSKSDLTVVLGTMLGGGGLDLRLIDRFPDAFDDAVGTPYVSSMTKGFYAVQPYVAFETRPLPWMASRLQLGFFWALTDRWSFEDVEFSGPPGTLTGLMASLTIQFGGRGVGGADEEDESSAEVEQQATPLETDQP